MRQLRLSTECVAWHIVANPPHRVGFLIVLTVYFTLKD